MSLPRRRPLGQLCDVTKWWTLSLHSLFASECDGCASPHNRRVINFGHTAARVPEVLEVRLQNPALLNLEGIRDLDQGFILTRHRLAGVHVEGGHLIGDAGIGKADRQRIVRPSGDHAGEGESGIEVEVNEVAVLWGSGEAGEDAHALRVLAARHT